ncbi:MAG: MFS transporter, partial [Sphingopyxis sp.]
MAHSLPTNNAASTAQHWTRNAVLVVGLCFAINMVDGMDVTIMSYIRGALSKAWNISDNVMGYALSAGLLGMAIGGLGIAPMADRVGRRPIILCALALMSVGMVACGFVHSIEELMVARVVVGAGIGTVLAAMAALAAEAAPAGRQDMAVGLVQAGYPLAAVATGFIVAAAEPVYGWQHLLLVAGIVTVAMLPVAYFILPEKARTAADAKLSTSQAVSALFGPALRTRTLMLWTATFMGLMVLYFIVSWITKLSVQAGLSETNSIYAGALYNGGAFIGTMMMSILSARVALTRLVPTLLICAVGAMMLFGSVAMPVGATLVVAFIIGVTLQGGYNGIWPIAAGAYPAENRATGIGWAVSVGRGGAIIGPIMGG